MSHNSIQQMWDNFKKENPQAPEDYEAWAFGDSKEMADELAALVLDGTKTATASNYLAYEETEPLPYAGLHNIILDGEGRAVAIAETTSVEVVLFNEVTEEHAYLEGEGDRTLKFWREEHESFFKKELEEVNQEFDHMIPVVCERLKLLYS
ncbi:ASCH domain-containing protein [Pontibacillus salipaludis]|uniref:RNA-binding protein n=1 Tax=Pontibacillus salipaludis TaxID=1697394 RepID=A0ABQ1Q5U0_9BACI|nr:ASCH domain-containing protein [Pontibacillus salipaludis]GGD14350.1 RNA-binding protein [Pontibacillus salipaludis]